MESIILRLTSSAILFVFCLACSQGPMGMDWSSTSDASSSLSSGASLNNPYETQALQILQTNCSSCHGQTSGPSGVYGLNDPNHMVASGLIVPGSPDQSPVYNSVAQASMPPGSALSNSDQSVLANWIAAGSAPVPTTTLPAPTSTTTTTTLPNSAPTFTYLKTNIFSSRCNGCHSFNSYSNVMSYVSAGNASGSRLYQDVNTGSMPKGSSKLSSAQIKAIYDWIQAGAKNN